MEKLEPQKPIISVVQYTKMLRFFESSCQLFLNVFSAGLKFLVRICTDLGLKDVQDFAQKLKKAEKARELKEQVGLKTDHRVGSVLAVG